MIFSNLLIFNAILNQKRSLLLIDLELESAQQLLQS